MAQTNCLLSGGYTLGCNDSTGGLNSIYIGNWSSNTTYALDSKNVITGTTSGTTLYKFDLVRQTAGANETINSSVENGTNYYTQECTLVFNKMEAELRNQILLLVAATSIVVVEDNNNNFWLMGKTKGCNVTGGNAGTGTAFGDRNGYSLTIQAMEPKLMHKIDYAAFSAQIQ